MANYQSGDLPNSRGTGLGANAQIGDDIQNLVKLNRKLQGQLAQLGTAGDTKELRSKMGKDRNDAKKLCQTIMQKFKQNQGGNKQLMGKLQDSFETELKKFNSVAKDIEAKEREVVAAINHRRDSLGAGGGEDDGQMEENVQFLEYDVEDLQRRSDGIKQIEKDVQEVSEMFHDLHELVQDQQQNLDIISDNITATKAKTESAHEELLQAEKYQHKARNKKCCILVILVVVITVIVLIVALK
jgi:t-SNARE complex subunit (syntaxin)